MNVAVPTHMQHPLKHLKDTQLYNMHFSLSSTLHLGLISLSILGSGVQSSRIPVPSWTGCPVDGPLLPRPTNLAESKHVKDATANITQALHSALKGKIKAGFEVDNTSFSISLVSPYHKPSRQNDSIIWSYHHLGKNNVDGTKSINHDSQYLIGSVSKVFSDLLLLQSDVDLNDPITKYLPGLGTKKNTPIQWDNITLSALSNHMAGIPANLREKNQKQTDSVDMLTLLELPHSKFTRCSRYCSFSGSLRWPTQVILPVGLLG